MFEEDNSENEEVMFNQKKKKTNIVTLYLFRFF